MQIEVGSQKVWRGEVCGGHGAINRFRAFPPTLGSIRARLPADGICCYVHFCKSTMDIDSKFLIDQNAILKWGQMEC